MRNNAVNLSRETKENKMELAKKILAKAEEKKDLTSMLSSAELCIVDCKYWIADGNEKLAVYRGLKSLMYSVGMLSDVYKRLAEQAKAQGFAEYVPN